MKDIFYDNIDSSNELVYTEYLIPIKVGKYSNEELEILEKIMKVNEELRNINVKYWTEVVDMAEKHNIEPWKLVRIKDDWDDVISLPDEHPDFVSLFGNYTFEIAETVIEGKPVFKDDILYTISGEKVKFHKLITDNERLSHIWVACFDISKTDIPSLRTTRIQDLSWGDKSRSVSLNIDDITYLRDFLKININLVDGVNYPRMLQIIGILNAVK